jgi:predicted 2-oxoglutarate/Fe(II)-dependent dioxygenase YbiX/peroxiredoxin
MVLTPGDPAPWFTVRSVTRPDFQFATMAGRYAVISFIGSAAHPAAPALLEGLKAGPYDNEFAALFLVSNDPADETQGRIAESKGAHIFWDGDGAVARLYGVAREDGDKRQIDLISFVLDPRLRVLKVVPVKDPASHGREIGEYLRTLPAPRSPGIAPALLVPRVLEPDFCRRLMDLYDQGSSIDSGFMRTDSASGRTILVKDHAVKRRRDVIIEDEEIRRQIQARLHRRLVPEIRKAFQFEASRIERYIVARYEPQDGSGFRPHRDNTTKGTAHRRFAVTINLNAEAYEGGDLVFPEFGGSSWRAPTGGAVVFSCSLMHEALPVTKGARYCFLPFLYDEAAAKIRQENSRFIDLPEENS